MVSKKIRFVITENTAHLPEALRVLAEAEGSTLSAYMRRVVLDHIKEIEEKEGPIIDPLLD